MVSDRPLQQTPPSHSLLKPTRNHGTRNQISDTSTLSSSQHAWGLKWRLVSILQWWMCCRMLDVSSPCALKGFNISMLNIYTVFGYPRGSKLGILGAIYSLGAIVAFHLFRTSTTGLAEDGVFLLVHLLCFSAPRYRVPLKIVRTRSRYRWIGMLTM